MSIILSAIKIVAGVLTAASGLGVGLVQAAANPEGLDLGVKAFVFSAVMIGVIVATKPRHE